MAVDDAVVGEATIRLRARIDRLQRDLDAARQKAEVAMGQAGTTAGSKFAAGFQSSGLTKLQATFTALGNSLKAGLAVGAAGGLVAAFTASATAVADAADMTQQLKARLEGLTGSTAAFPLAVANAKSLGISLDDSANALARIAIAGQSLSLSLDQQGSIARTLGELGRLGGSSGSELASTMTQVSQALASGVLQGDELRSVMEGMPLLAKLLAERLGVSTGELKSLGSEGAITSRILADTLLAAADSTAEKFKELGTTGAQAGQNLETSWTLLMAALDQRWSASSFRKDIYENLDAALGKLREFVALAPASDRLATALAERDRLAQTAARGGIPGAAASGALRSKDLEIAQLEAELAAEAAKASKLAANAPAGQPGTTPGTPPVVDRAAARAFEREQQAIEDQWLEGLRIREQAEAETAETIDRLIRGTGELQAETDLKRQAVTLEQTAAGRVQLAVMRERLALLRETADAVAIAGPAELQAIQDASAARLDAVRAAAMLSEQIANDGKITAFTDQVADDVVGVFSAIAFQGEKAGDAVKNLIVQLLELVAQQAILVPAAKAISGALASMIGSNAPAGTTTTSPGASAGQAVAQGGLQALFSAGVSALFGFAEGGVMVPGLGPRQLERFATGGISSEAAIFGEGALTEAAVPLPDGRSIPVSFRGDGPQRSGGVFIQVDAKGSNSPAETEAAGYRGAMRAMAEMRRNPRASRFL